MVQFWMSWCRLCAREDTFNSHLNILLIDSQSLPLIETINKCFLVDINNYNDLPIMICTECFSLIRATIDLSQRIAKVSAMFSELQVIKEEDSDAFIIKARHNLKCDFKIFPIYPLESSSILSETKVNLPDIDEQMVETDLVNCKETDDQNPINIEIKKDEDDLSTDGFLAQESEEYSSSIEENSIKKETQNPEKRKYRSRVDRIAQNSMMPFYCSECSKGFLKMYNYRRHMQSAHEVIIEYNPLLFICKNCGKEFKSVSALKDHEYTHTEERTLKCKYCEKAFKSIRSLNLHEDTHNETNYICVICGLKLNTLQTLRNHMVVHSDQKKYKCDHCGNEFKRVKALKNHLILHTGLKPYSCDFCSRTFASGANCRSHKKKNHPEELAAQEATGTKNMTKIPKLSELKAVFQ